MQTLELVTFRTPNTDSRFFLDANTEINDWLKRQPGFVSRHLAAKEDGSWVDVVLWSDHGAATKAGAKLLDELAQCAAITAIDPASIAMSHAGVHLSVS